MRGLHLNIYLVQIIYFFKSMHLPLKKCIYYDLSEVTGSIMSGHKLTWEMAMQIDNISSWEMFRCLLLAGKLLGFWLLMLPFYSSHGR